MRKTFCVLFLLAISVLLFGCGGGSNNAGVMPLTPDTVNNETLTGDASIRLNVVSSAEKPGIKASVAGGEVSVTCVIKVLRPDNPAQFDELRKTATVSNGAASFFFSSVPARSAVVKLVINGGKIGEYAELRGAKDLTTGENPVDIAGVGSGLEPDVVAGAVENLSNKGSVSSNIQNNIVANVKSAFTTTINVAGSTVPNLVENVSQVYLAQTSPTIPEQDNIKTYVNQFAKTTSLLPDALSQKNANMRQSLRAGIRYWSWDDTYRNWNYFLPGYYYDEGMLLTFCFRDANGTGYPTIDAAPGINTIGIGNVIDIRTSYGKLRYLEVYNFTALSETRYQISGLFEASIAGIKFMAGIPNKITVDVGNPYPVSGEFAIALLGTGACSVTYNGTCVADVVYVGDDGSRGSTKVIIAPSFIMGESSTGSIRASLAPATAPTEMQQALAAFNKK